MGRNGVGDGVLGLYDGSFVGENEGLGVGTLLGDGIGDDVRISAELCLMVRVREVESPLLGSVFCIGLLAVSRSCSGYLRTLILP